MTSRSPFDASKSTAPTKVKLSKTKGRLRPAIGSSSSRRPKWRRPVEGPVLPNLAMGAPAFTTSPTFTLKLPWRKCAYQAKTFGARIGGKERQWTRSAATRRFAVITRGGASGLEAPLKSAGGMAALILTHGNRQATLRICRNPIRIARKAAAFSYDGRALRRRVGIREANVAVEARRLQGGRALRLRRVRSRG